MEVRLITTNSQDPRYKLFGVRHHGPGTARALVAALAEWKPDIVLIEGPADATPLVYWLEHELMEPPISLLMYRPDMPERSAIFPFAIFSPEYQAVQYAREKVIPIRFFDLPQSMRLATEVRPALPSANALNAIAHAGGYPNYEMWWNSAIEQSHNMVDLFDGVLEMMTVARNSAEPFQSKDPAALKLAEQREAYMRTSMRKAIDDGFERVAVIAGAWHTPALMDLYTLQEDRRLLAGMPSVEVEASWIPWTYGRMSARSGYGAGLQSPGWYQHLWASAENEITIGWLSKTAQLLREQGYDASAAHVIEAVRLAEALAAMRNLPRPTLDELTEVTQTVLCYGDSQPLDLIREKLIVGEAMGRVPPDVPLVPLQRDLQNEQTRLELRPNPELKTHEFDLREPRDLERSLLLNRLNLIQVPWGRTLSKRATQHRIQAEQGTYLEVWRLQWRPDFPLKVIEMNLWGNTIVTAASSYAIQRADTAKNLSDLTALLDKLMLCDLPDAMQHLMQQLDHKAALSSDVLVMIDALPPLVRILRYGSVRYLDKTMVQQVVDGLITRICINLPSTIVRLDNDAAEELYGKIGLMQQLVHTLNQPEQKATWQAVLEEIAAQRHVHHLLVGQAVRLLFDDGVFSAETTALHMQQTLVVSQANSADQLIQIGFWIEGFLKGSDLIMLHDEQLWSLLDRWIVRLESSDFKGVLPLLRRTFATFGESSREQMHRKVKGGRARVGVVSAEFDTQRAEKIISFATDLLNLPNLEDSANLE